MQDVSKTITIEVEEFKKMLLDAHECSRYRVKAFHLEEENKALRKELEAVRNVANS